LNLLLTFFVGKKKRPAGSSFATKKERTRKLATDTGLALQIN
jgi:hypothetical protein